MKKIIIVFCSFLLLAGCSCSLNDHTPEEAIETFFEKYRSKDDDVIDQLKDTILNEKLDDDSSMEYKKLMEKQYDQFSYVIKNIDKKQDSATATVKLTVLNYKSAILQAEEDLKNNPDKFKDEDGNFSEEKYKVYKIELMKKVTDTVTNTININLTKENGMWKVEQLTNDAISKLHGLY